MQRIIIGYVTIISIENDHGPSVMNHHKSHQKLNLFQTSQTINLTSLEPKINSYIYCRQLMKPKDAIEEKWPELANPKEIAFPYNYAEILVELCWKMM